MRFEVKEILEGARYSEQIEEIDKRMLSRINPNSWNVNSKENMEVFMESEFHKYMFAIKEHTDFDIKTITVFQFYALEEYIKEKNVKK